MQEKVIHSYIYKHHCLDLTIQKAIDKLEIQS